jgi:CheY-like chemotaxis protein
MKAERPRLELPFTFVVAEDDPDDRLLIEQAFRASDLSGDLLFFEDGERLLDYLLDRQRNPQAILSSPPMCILLDLNMPGKGGRQALEEIRQHPELKDLPVVVLTTSDSQEDRQYCADLGACDYFTKPGNFAELTALMSRIRSVCSAG